MRVGRKLNILALGANLAGAILLFYSFQAASSPFRLIKRDATNGAFFGGSTPQYDICIGDFTLLSTDAQRGLGLGHAGCNPAKDDRPAAVVNTEHPVFVTIGFILTLLGFFIQLLAALTTNDQEPNRSATMAASPPRSLSDLRHEINLRKAEDKLKYAKQDKTQRQSRRARTAARSLRRSGEASRSR